MKIQGKLFAIFASLALLMAVTRGSHFGNSYALPDATLAVFLLAGFFMPRFSLQALLTFLLLLLEAGGIDYYAINTAGVDDYCVTPAYLFLIPTYATMWLGGGWFAARQQNNWLSLGLFGMISTLTTSIAFLISNAGFFMFSGRFTEMGTFEYAGRVAKYYPSYLSGSLMYLALAALVYAVLSKLNQSAADTSQP